MDTYIIGYWIGLIIGGLGIGVLCGLIPFFLGKKYNNKTLGIAGFFTCVVSGFILGIILALPVAGVFSLIIYLAREQ